jgi:hypothetical protein
MIFLFSSIILLQQGVLALQPNQTSSKNITSQATGYTSGNISDQIRLQLYPMQPLQRQPRFRLLLLLNHRLQVAVDTKFVVKIDNKGVDYKEVANNLNARILGIDFSKGDRVVEITGTQMTP